MSRFIEGEDRHQATLFPERLDEYMAEDSAVRVIDVFIDDLDLSGLGFKAEPESTGRPRYHPATLLKLYVYGCLNRVQSSRRLEREAPPPQMLILREIYHSLPEAIEVWVCQPMEDTPALNSSNPGHVPGGQSMQRGRRQHPLSFHRCRFYDSRKSEFFARPPIGLEVDR